MNRRPQSSRERIVVPLDVAGEEELLRLVDSLSGRVGFFKIGFELFTALGPRAVQLVRERGQRVFLDLKYHDIPNTVARAVRAASRLGVSMLTVHAWGATGMLGAAVAAAAESQSPPVILAVTVLTSLEAADLSAVGIDREPASQVVRLAELAVAAGVDGLVASPREAGKLRGLLGPGPLLVTPGVRPSGSERDDQVRVATPGQALADGADYLVIGRPITRAPDPAAAAEAICKELDDSV